jgi:endonuclease III
LEKLKESQSILQNVKSRNLSAICDHFISKFGNKLNSTVDEVMNIIRANYDSLELKMTSIRSPVYGTGSRPGSGNSMELYNEVPHEMNFFTQLMRVVVKDLQLQTQTTDDARESITQDIVRRSSSIDSLI